MSNTPRAIESKYRYGLTALIMSITQLGMSPADFRRVAHFANAPDLYLNSLWDPERAEVSAFEGLVGCHGGLGGWQNRGLVIHPAGWPIEEHISGADGLHRQLVKWLEDLGHRHNLAYATRQAAPTN